MSRKRIVAKKCLNGTTEVARDIIDIMPNMETGPLTGPPSQADFSCKLFQH